MKSLSSTITPPMRQKMLLTSTIWQNGNASLNVQDRDSGVFRYGPTRNAAISRVFRTNRIPPAIAMWFQVLPSIAEKRATS
jgi:hypothetical protein